MKKSIEIWDSHVHVTENGKWFNTSLDASLRNLITEMDIANVQKSLILPIYGVTSNLFVKKCVRMHGDRLAGFGCMSLKTWKNDAQEILEYGLQGVKFHPRIQHETISQWDQAGILKFLEVNNLPIIVCGWQQTSSPVANMLEIHPLKIDLVAKKYPNLKIIIAHLGGHNFLDSFFCARGNPNVFLDCSYFFHFFKGTSIESDSLILMQKLDNKILFGTDFPEVSIDKYHNYLKVEFEKYNIDYDKIFSKNINKIISSNEQT